MARRLFTARENDEEDLGITTPPQPGGEEDENAEPDPATDESEENADTDADTDSPETTDPSELDTDSLTQEEDEEKKNALPENPLNVDLVYRQEQMRLNDETDKPLYEEIGKILAARKVGTDPIGQDIEVSQQMKNDPEPDGTDLNGDETTSKHDDYDSEKYERLEYEDMSIENYHIRFAAEAGYGTPAGDYMLANMKDTAVGTAKVAGRGAAAVGRAVGPVAGKAASLAGKGAMAVGKKGLTAAAFVADKTFSLVKKEIISLSRYYDKHKSRFMKIEKELLDLRKSLVLLKDIDTSRPYNDYKVLTNVLNDDTKSMLALFASQHKFHEEFSRIVIDGLSNQKIVMDKMLKYMNSEELESMTMRNFTLDTPMKGVMVPFRSEGIDETILKGYETKELLVANKRLLAVLPREDLDTIDDYVSALQKSKVVIDVVHVLKIHSIKTPSQKELLDTLDMALSFTRQLQSDKEVFNKMTGIKSALMSTLSRFNILSRTEAFLKTESAKKKSVRAYLEDSVSYTDKVYIDPYINLNNAYYNSLKYFVHFARDILKRH